MTSRFFTWLRSKRISVRYYKLGKGFLAGGLLNQILGVDSLIHFNLIILKEWTYLQSQFMNSKSWPVMPS